MHMGSFEGINEHLFVPVSGNACSLCPALSEPSKQQLWMCLQVSSCSWEAACSSSIPSVSRNWSFPGAASPRAPLGPWGQTRCPWELRELICVYAAAQLCSCFQGAKFSFITAALGMQGLEFPMHSQGGQVAQALGQPVVNRI